VEALRKSARRTRFEGGGNRREGKPMEIHVDFDKALVESFMDALTSGSPLDPSGKWTGDKILMAAAVLRYASANVVNWDDGRPASEHPEYAEARGTRDSLRVETVIHNLAAICFMVRKGLYSETYSDRCTLAINADHAI
jgi:hypothetical protein